MGYRNYIGSITKKKLKNLKKLKSMEQFEIEYPEMFEYCDYSKKNEMKSIRHILEDDDLFEFGKYCDSELSKLNKPVFHKSIRDVITSDNEFEVMTKEGLRNIIQYYVNKTLEYLNKLKNSLESKDVDAIIRDISNSTNSKIFDIENHMYGVVDMEFDAITTSWSYEYNIFELTRIYKTFDWKRKCLIWHGW